MNHQAKMEFMKSILLWFSSVSEHENKLYMKGYLTEAEKQKEIESALTVAVESLNTLK